MYRTVRVIRTFGLFMAMAMTLLAGCRKTTDAAATANYWLTDFEKAKQTAGAEGKDLLINFAGSDWCYWCQKLDSEVFSKQDFIRQAGKSFVFVMVDFPNDTSHQSAELQKQNQALSEQFRVEGFPTVFLADATGKPYAKTGYLEGGVQTYLKHLSQLRNQPKTP